MPRQYGHESTLFRPQAAGVEYFSVGVDRVVRRTHRPALSVKLQSVGLCGAGVWTTKRYRPSGAMIVR